MCQITTGVVYLLAVVSGTVVSGTLVTAEQYLWTAAHYGDLHTVKEIVAKGVNPNWQNSVIFGMTPLIVASWANHPDVVKVLLAGGAEIDRQTDGGSTSLYIASFHGHTKVVQILLNAGADTSIKNEGGFTPLYVASQQGHTDIIKLLISAGSAVWPVGWPDDMAKSPLLSL